jgi:hypothetical protein
MFVFSMWIHAPRLCEGLRRWAVSWERICRGGDGWGDQLLLIFRLLLCFGALESDTLGLCGR